MVEITMIIWIMNIILIVITIIKIIIPIKIMIMMLIDKKMRVKKTKFNRQAIAFLIANW